MSVSTPGITPGRASTYPAKTVRPLMVAKWPKSIQNHPSYIPYSAKISHLISTNLAAIAALQTNLTVSQSYMAMARTEETSGFPSTKTIMQDDGPHQSLVHLGFLPVR